MLEQFELSEAPVIPVADNIEGGGTIDVLAQKVIPKLINKVHMQGSYIERLERAVEALLQNAQEQKQAYEYLHKWSLKATDQINALSSPATKTRRKKKAEVPMSEIADYDPDVDVWMAKTIDGVAILGTVIDDVDQLGIDAGTKYPASVLAFVDKLTDAQRAAIKEKFPG